MATIYDVAKKADVSIATVSRVLNGNPKVDLEMRRRVLEAVQAVRYVPNGTARSLVTKQTRRVALLISDITNPFFADTARGAQDALDERGYQLLLANSDDQPARERRYLSLFAETGVDGILIEAAIPDKKGEVARRTLSKQLQAMNLPVVGFTPSPITQQSDTVTIDEDLAGFKAVDHLLGLGHRQIAMVNGPESNVSARLRARGYRRALERHGVSFDPGLEAHGLFHRESGYAALRALLERGAAFSAVFAADSLIATGVLRALREFGKRVPQDVAIVCIGDDVATAELEPPLTTVLHPRGYEFGRLGSQLLLERILSPDASGIAPRVAQLETRLIVRASTVALPSPAIRRARVLR